MGFGGEWGNYTDADSAPIAKGAYLSLTGDRFYEPAGARFLTRGGPGANGYQADDPNDGEAVPRQIRRHFNA